MEAFLAEGIAAAKAADAGAVDPTEAEDDAQHPLPKQAADSDAVAEPAEDVAAATPEVEPNTTADDADAAAAAPEVAASDAVLPSAQRAILTELFAETESILQALLEHMDEEEVVVALHCANFIQQAATIVLARALRGPAVNVRTLHLGAKTRK